MVCGQCPPYYWILSGDLPMVAIKEHFPRFTPEEYFDWEEQQLERHEYIDGEVYAMSGGTINHGRIAIKITSMLDTPFPPEDYRIKS
jgi:Uma2 family endonuclease